MLHLLDLDGLDEPAITDFLDHAESLLPQNGSWQTAGFTKNRSLEGLTVVNLFFEGSTRTRSAFEIAAKRMSADVINFDAISSSTSKGETLRDTLLTLHACGGDIFVVRHGFSGAVQFAAERVLPSTGVINAGDGSHAHPTQALLDLLTIRQLKKDFAQLRVVIVGDILHSRVGRSLIHGLNILNVPEICVCAPLTLMPDGLEERDILCYNDLEQAVKGADVVIALRLQTERMQSNLLPSAHEYFRYWGLSESKLKGAKPDVIVMHPGPINRGLDIASELADGSRSSILRQVANGMAVRMAVLDRIGQSLKKLRAEA
ncbi:MAG: aspartate carbamoyltransferase catalytic subunit [Gammaproteobacteria bacterium]